MQWSLHLADGDPGRVLRRMGEAIDARLFVIGTRGGELSETMREWVDGSVVAHLSRRQERPVLVVPTPSRDERHHTASPVASPARGDAGPARPGSPLRRAGR